MTPREFLEQLQDDPTNDRTAHPSAYRQMYNRTIRAWVDDNSEIAKFVRAYEEANHG